MNRGLSLLLGAPAASVSESAAAAPPPAWTQGGLWDTIVQAGVSEQAVMAGLFLMSVFSWAVILFKLRVMRRAYRASAAFLGTFWEVRKLEAVFRQSEAWTESPVAQVFRAGYGEVLRARRRQEHHDGEHASQVEVMETVERSMRRTALTEKTRIESWVSFLATAGSTAPFIGLLGTVIGIMNSFQEIGQMGNANLVTVAPGIGGALVATAFGLFAAIPAVVAYNYFLSRLRVLEAEVESFSADFLNIVRRQSSTSSS